MDEQQAIARLKQGDLSGLEFLVRQYQAQAVHTAYLIIGDSALAEDVVQIVFLRIAQRIDQFDPRRPFRPWFLRAVVNDAIKAAKHQQRTVSLDDPSEAVLKWLVDPSKMPEEFAETGDLRRAVWNALQQLAPEQRAVIVQRHFLEMSEAEMVAEHQRPASTVKWWLYTARERLKVLLRPEQDNAKEPFLDPRPGTGRKRMKNAEIQVILAEIAEQAAPSAKIDLWPEMRQRLATSKAIFQQGDTSMKTGFFRTPMLRRAALALLAIVIASAILLATPQGRAIAQDFLKYFTTSSQKWLPPWPMPAPVPTYTLETEMATAQPTPVDIQGCGPVISPISSTFLCQLKYAQSKLGYVVKSFPANYVDAAFHAMDFNFNPEYKTIRLSFRGGVATYTLEQRLGDFPAENMGNAIYQGAIQLTQVGKYPAEYAAGEFIFSEDNSMTWSPAEPVYHLRWKEDEKSYSFTMSISQDNGVMPDGIQEKMIQIAENLVSLDQGAEQLTAGRQPSIKDSAGFAIKEPGRLPGMFQQVFATGWNYLIPNKVNMEYESTENGEVVGFLEFSQIPIPADEKNLRWEFAEMYRGGNVKKDFIVDEEVQINGAIGHYLVPSGELPPQALYWRDNEREYILVCQWTSGYGGRLSKDDLIAIAESLK